MLINTISNSNPNPPTSFQQPTHVNVIGATKMRSYGSSESAMELTKKLSHHVYNSKVAHRQIQDAAMLDNYGNHEVEIDEDAVTCTTSQLHTVYHKQDDADNSTTSMIEGCDLDDNLTARRDNKEKVSFSSHNEKFHERSYYSLNAGDDAKHTTSETMSVDWFRKVFTLFACISFPVAIYYLSSFTINHYIGFNLSLYQYSESKSVISVSLFDYDARDRFSSMRSAATIVPTSAGNNPSEKPLYDIEFSVFNEYTKSVPLSGDYNWTTIVEPYRVTYFEVRSPLPGVTYRWYVDGEYIGSGFNLSCAFQGPSGVSQLLAVKGYMFNIGERKQENEEDSVLLSLQVALGMKEVMVKYVRREIRSLVAQDRVAFFQAVSIMQRVPNAVGQAIYGKNYHSKDFFNRIHLYFGGAQDCDHWHTGVGFVVSHFAYSSMFEKSLQSINPMLSLSYWDFTTDSTLFDAETFRDTMMFSDGWFGDAKAENNLHTPLTGRFAYVSVMQNAVNFSRLTNGYGLLRAPWNADPIPYMTRAANVYDYANNLKPSGCVEYFRTLQQRSWMKLGLQLNSATHGHIHELIGGSYGFKKALKSAPYSKISYASYDGMHQFQHITEAASKLLWRYGYLTCPGYDTGSTTTGGSNTGVPSSIISGLHCPFRANAKILNYGDLKIDTSNCECTCTYHMYLSSFAYTMYELGITKNMIYYDPDRDIEIGPTAFAPILNATDTPMIKGYTAEESLQIYEEIRDYLCDMGKIGDMFQATSSNDITFWLLHPNMERVWHLSRISSELSLISFNETWDNTANTCVGHRSSDATPFKGLFGESNSNTVYTNAELYTLLSPNNPKMPFVYDNFRYHHCEIIGYDMTGLDLHL